VTTVCFVGNGTIGLELLNQAADLDNIIVPVGGGSLIAGVAMAAKEINPKIRIIGVEAAKTPSMARRLAGDLSMIPAVTSIADSINVRHIGDMPLDICRRLVDEFVSVTDEEICKAMLLLLEGEKCVAEGAAAAAIAALISKKVDVSNQKTAALITGGNIDVNTVSMIIEKGLVDNGRRVKISMNLPDKPGALSILIDRISGLKANM
jgi:threonine dehydratase